MRSRQTFSLFYGVWLTNTHRTPANAVAIHLRSVFEQYQYRCHNCKGTSAQCAPPTTTHSDAARGTRSPRSLLPGKCGLLSFYRTIAMCPFSSVLVSRDASRLSALPRGPPVCVSRHFSRSSSPCFFFLISNFAYQPAQCAAPRNLFGLDARAKSFWIKANHQTFSKTIFTRDARLVDDLIESYPSPISGYPRMLWRLSPVMYSGASESRMRHNLRHTQPRERERKQSYSHSACTFSSQRIDRTNHKHVCSDGVDGVAGNFERRTIVMGSASNLLLLIIIVGIRRVVTSVPL